MELYITNEEETERLDLINDLNIEKGTVNFNWEETFEIIKQQFLNVTVSNDEFKEYDIKVDSMINDWSNKKKLLSRKQANDRLKLFYKENGELFVCYIKHRPKRTVAPIANTNYTQISIDLTVIGYFFKIELFRFRKKSVLNQSNYPIEYNSFKYIESHTKDGTLTITNNADDRALFKLIIKNRSNNPEWMSLRNNEILNSGLVYGLFEDDLIIDTLTSSITYQNRSVKQHKEPEKATFFAIDTGKTEFKIKGADGDFDLYLYLPYLTP